METLCTNQTIAESLWKVPVSLTRCVCSGVTLLGEEFAGGAALGSRTWVRVRPPSKAAR